jgi:hypothetical protein
MMMAQEVTQAPSSASNNDQVHVNWLYGSYVPKEVPLQAMNGGMRFKLYVRQTYTTWGIYFKTLCFALRDQNHGTFPEWGDGFEGFMKRYGSRQGQFILQNSVISPGDGLLGWDSMQSEVYGDTGLGELFGKRFFQEFRPAFELRETTAHCTIQTRPQAPL